MRLPSNKAQVVPVSMFTPVTIGHGVNWEVLGRLEDLMCG
jgi:hypothetical protein